MPELAEVAYYARRWDGGIGGKIRKVQLHRRARVFREMSDPGKLDRSLTGQVYHGHQTHGKKMLFQFGDTVWLIGHLGMTGELHTIETSDYQPEKHDHLVLFQKERALVYTDPRMFGDWRWASCQGVPDAWQKLSPPVDSSGFTKKRLGAFLQRRGRSPLKAVLLDQAMFPGIGNWMADEILWRCPFHPNRKAGTLQSTEVALLWSKTRLVARQAMRVISVDWKKPPDTWLFNHRWKDGGTCPCGAPLVRQSIGGRTTCWCPTCQDS